MVNKPANVVSRRQSLSKVSKSSMKINKKSKEDAQVEQLLRSLKSILPPMQAAVHDDLDIVEGAISYIRDLRCLLASSSDDVDMMELCFATSKSST